MNRELILEEEKVLRISKGDFDESAAQTLHLVHGKRVDVEFPSWLNEYCYTLRSRGHVGHIPISNDIMLIMRPKIDIDNLFRMLEYAYNLRSFDFLEGKTKVNSLDDLFDRLASILAKLVLDRVRRGLYRSYVEEEELLPNLRGRVRVKPSVLAFMRGSANLQCEYEEQTTNVDDNRILAWTLYLLPRFSIKREDVRCQVRQAYRALAGTTEIRPVDASDCVHRIYHRLNDDYRRLHGLCRFFLENRGPSIKIGEYDFIPFVVNMSSLFQSFVAEWMKANLPDLRLETQYHVPLGESGTGEFIIDFLLREKVSGRVIAVMDTKYKRPQRPDEGDIQQVVAYAVSMNTKNAFLIYPSAATEVIRIGLPAIMPSVFVRSLVFDIERPIEEAGHSFIKGLKEALLC